jgi:hypothetical protein
MLRRTQGHSILVIGSPALGLKQLAHFAIAVTAVLLGQPDLRQAQLIVVLVTRPVLQGAAREPDNSACAALGGTELLACVDDCVAKLAGAQPFGF